MLLLFICLSHFYPVSLSEAQGMIPFYLHHASNAIWETVARIQSGTLGTLKGLCMYNGILYYFCLLLNSWTGPYAASQKLLEKSLCVHMARKLIISLFTFLSLTQTCQPSQIVWKNNIDLHLIFQIPPFGLHQCSSVRVTHDSKDFGACYEHLNFTHTFKCTMGNKNNEQRSRARGGEGEERYEEKL